MIERLIAFLRWVDPDSAEIMKTTAIPGTAIYNNCRANIRWSQFRDFEKMRTLDIILQDDNKLMFHECSSDDIFCVLPSDQS